jgi:hypothetical protein
VTDDDRATRLNDGEDLEIAEPEDFGISRDADGDLKPVKQRIPGTNKAIKCKPVIDSEPIETALEAADPSEDDIDAVGGEYIVAGLGADGTLSDLPDYIIQGVLQALKNASGNDIFLAVENQRVEENVGQLKAVNAEDLEKMQQLLGNGEGEELDLDELPQA